MIFFLKSCGPESCLKPLQEDSSAPNIKLLHYDEVFGKARLARGTYVFTDIDRLSTAALTDAARLFRRLQENGCRVLNDPARVRTRFDLLRTLHRSGLNPINAYLPDEGECPKQFPVFIRIADDHRGSLSDLIWNQSALDSAIEAAVVAGYPRSKILIVEYAAQPIRPDVFRKSSVYRVGDCFITDIWWYGTSWNIKGDRDGLADKELYKEELQMMRENSFAKEVTGAFALANIDYGRLDFGLVDGRPCIYEINTYPTLFGPRHHPVAERVESITLRWTKLLAAFHAIDTELSASQELVEVTGTSIKALQEAGAVSPDLRFNHLRLSEEHGRRGNLSEALESAEAAVGANPDNIKALCTLSRNLTRHNRYEDAIAVSQRVLELSPRRTAERRYLANLMLKAGRFEEARDQLLEALALGEPHWKTHLLLSSAYQKLGAFEEERKQLLAAKRASELAPDDPAAAACLKKLAQKAAKERHSRLKIWRTRFVRFLRAVVDEAPIK